MGRFILRRIALALVTLAPERDRLRRLRGDAGDVARSILGPTAAPETVEALNEELGTDRPVFVRYGDWVAGPSGRSRRFLRLSPAGGRDDPTGALELGEARLPRLPARRPARDPRRGVAALYEGRATDRLVSVGGLSASAIPEFVWAVVAILVFGLWLDVLPSPRRHLRVRASSRRSSTSSCRPSASSSSSSATSPGWPAGTVEALDSDYTRTAVLKGSAQHRDPQARAAQLAPPHHRRRGDADRLPDRRPRGDRADLQLPGHRAPARPRGRPEGLPASRAPCS